MKQRKEMFRGDETLKDFSTSRGQKKTKTNNQPHWGRDSNTFIQKMQPTHSEARDQGSGIR
jgi:hypothetical protein